MSQIAQDCGCTLIDEFPGTGRDIDIGAVIENLDRMYRRYGNSVVLYGGQLATPWFYGFKKMRSTTNDVDLAVSAAMLERVIREYHPNYIPRLEIFLASLDGTPFIFTAEHIHDWEIAGDFFDTAKVHSFGSLQTVCCSREYLIALKLRRGTCSDHSLFGKDAIDILNIITAPFVRHDLTPVDLKLSAELFLRHTGAGGKEIVWVLSRYTEHLPQEYRQLCAKELSFLQNLIAGETT